MTLPREILAELSQAAGEGALVKHAPVEVDGVAIDVTLHPADGAALARTLEGFGRWGVAALVRGGASRLGLGNPPREAGAFLSTERLSGVDEFEPGEGVCHAAAGTTLAELRARVAGEGWDLPFDPPGERTSVGGAVASAAVGPRALGFGPPRDHVLGLEVVLASGERTRCGGRVVKNVTGYDLNKLYTGSLGTLGVIEGAWLRLRPLPERTFVLEAESAQFEGACAAGLSAARLASTRAAAVVAPAADGDGGFRLVVELAGDEPCVERDAGWLAETLGAGEAAPGALDRTRALQAHRPGGDGMRFRIATLASRMAPALGALREAGAAVLVYPGLGLVYAGFHLAEADARAAERAFGCVARVAREAGGSWILEEGPAWAKQGRDVFGAGGELLALVRALKSRFDPGGVLNPGRFMGFV